MPKGMPHEHNRPDRDVYIELVPVIDPLTLRPCVVNGSRCCKEQFEKQSPLISNDYGLPYDHCSLMHYGNVDGTAFIGQCYVIPKDVVPDCTIKFQHFDNVGQRVGLSRWDKEAIRRKYSCLG